VSELSEEVSYTVKSGDTLYSSHNSCLICINIMGQMLNNLTNKIYL